MYIFFELTLSFKSTINATSFIFCINNWSDNANSYNFKNNKYFYYGYKVELRHYIDSKLKLFNRLRRYIYKRFGI